MAPARKLLEFNANLDFHLSLNRCTIYLLMCWRWRSTNFNHLKSLHKLHFSLNALCGTLCAVAFCWSFFFAVWAWINWEKCDLRSDQANTRLQTIHKDKQIDLPNSMGNRCCDFNACYTCFVIVLVGLLGTSFDMPWSVVIKIGHRREQKNVRILKFPHSIGIIYLFLF